MSRSNVWTLRETLVVAVIGAVFALLYLGWVQLWLIAQAAIGSLSMDIFMGFWFVASIVAAAIVRKPGVALVAEVLAAAVQVLIGSPAGLMLIVSGFIQGLGAETVFAATRWRNYSLPVLMAAGVGAAVFSYAYTWMRFDYGALDPTILVVMFVLRCASGALLGGWLGKVIVDQLYRTGALSGFAIDADRRTAGAAEGAL